MARVGVPLDIEQIALRVKARLLRQLKAVPVSAWAACLVDSLEMLAAIGLCPRAFLDNRIRNLLAGNGSDQRADRMPAAATDVIRQPRTAADVVFFEVPGSDSRRSAHRANTRRSQDLSPEVRQIRHLIHTHYREPLSLRSLARDVGRNAQYLSTIFHKQTGITVHSYLTVVRMNHAAKLLRRSEKVEAVMLLVGYRSKKNFYRQFSNSFGMTPGLYKAQHSEQQILCTRSGVRDRRSLEASRPVSPPAPSASTRRAEES
jgi:AraC-like DNA-binding protein